MNVNVAYRCESCGYETILKWKGHEFFDKDGNKINFRRSCPNCGSVERLNKQEGC